MQRPTPENFADPRWCEAQYNPRLTIDDPAGKLKQWAEWSAQARGALVHRTIAYGPHAREVLDLFPAKNPRGLLAYIHGGYWRAQHKDDFSFVAEALVPAGYSVAVITYPLCPEVTVREIARSCDRAVEVLWQQMSGAERAQFVLSGHSAGGYLAAGYSTWHGVPSTSHGMQSSQSDVHISRRISYSGVFELAPLLKTSMNELVRLAPTEAASWSLHDKAPPAGASRLILTYGADEPAEFHRQSLHLAAHWRDICPPAVAIKNANHFSIVEQLRDPASQVFALVRQALEGQNL